MTVSRLKSIVLFAGITFIGLGIFQMIRAFNPVTPEPGRNKGYNSKESRFLYKNVSLEESWHYDSIKGATFKSEICFRNTIYIPKTDANEMRFNLLDPNYKNLPKVYGLYYIVMTCLWGFVFYYFYQLVCIFYKDEVFDLKNPELLKKLGKLIFTIGYINFTGIMVMYIFVNLWKDISIPFYFDYDIIFNYLFLIILGHMLNMFSNAFNRGIKLEQDQSLII